MKLQCRCQFQGQSLRDKSLSQKMEALEASDNVAVMRASVSMCDNLQVS